MRDVKIALVVLIGMGIGFVIGFIGPLGVCAAVDAITRPRPGNGLMTIGWVVCFVTIPLFTAIGGFWFRAMALRRMPAY
jgi:hypothetical protein